MVGDWKCRNGVYSLLCFGFYWNLAARLLNEVQFEILADAEVGCVLVSFFKDPYFNY